MFNSPSLSDIDSTTPILIAGPTASGKSALALHLAQKHGGLIINADALQVFDGWHLLTARPSADDLSQAPHHLYGHVPFDAAYSAGHWLRDIAPLLTGARPIIVGGTGLYFQALTQGLAEIPATPTEVRAEADALSLAHMLGQLPDTTQAGLDIQNRARVQRAWEVWRATGRHINDWQADTPAPLLPLAKCKPLVLRPDPEWLLRRIELRFDQMLEQGALDEARAMLPGWNPAHTSAKAIGAAELIAHLNGEISLKEARSRAIIATRRYAKRQRTWFRSKMADWCTIELN